MFDMESYIKNMLWISFKSCCCFQLHQSSIYILCKHKVFFFMTPIIINHWSTMSPVFDTMLIYFNLICPYKHDKLLWKCSHASSAIKDSQIRTVGNIQVLLSPREKDSACNKNMPSRLPDVLSLYTLHSAEAGGLCGVLQTAETDSCCSTLQGSTKVDWLPSVPLCKAIRQ